MKTDAAKAKEEAEKIKEIPVKLSEGEIKQKKIQRKSVSYALKAINSHIDTLAEDRLLDQDMVVNIKRYVKEAAEMYVKREFGIE